MATLDVLETITVEADRPTVDAMVDRAKALVPMLTGSAQATEDNRSILPATVSAFEDAGFYRMLQPATFGGYEMRPDALFRVAMELARGCPSSAWCLCLVAVHNWEIGLLDPKAGEAIWGDDTSTRLSSSYAPFGTVEKVDGGFRVSGRWPWSSGCDHCQWVILGGVAPSAPGGPPDSRAFIIPRSDYVIDDTWHVLGLKGTGSKDVVVDGAFVPEHLTHKFGLSFLGMDEGAETYTAPTYRYPFGVVFAHCLSSVTIGMAEGALEAFMAQMIERRGSYDGAKAMEDPFVRQRLAEADAIVRGLRQRFDAVFAALRAAVDAGGPIPVELRAQCKWDAQFIAKEAMRAVEMLFKAAGGRGVRQENPLQRFFRDVHTASNHAFLNADKGALNAGYVAMGGATSDFAV